MRIPGGNCSDCTSGTVCDLGMFNGFSFDAVFFVVKMINRVRFGIEERSNNIAYVELSVPDSTTLGFNKMVTAYTTVLIGR